MSARWMISLLVLPCASLAATALANPPAAPAEAAAGKDGVVVTGEKPTPAKVAGKITDPKHPDFVKCRSEPVLNSRAQRVKVCRTNREWTAFAREGNRQTQEMLNAGRPTQPTP